MKKKVTSAILITMLIWLLAVISVMTFVSVAQTKEILHKEFEVQIDVSEDEASGKATETTVSEKDSVNITECRKLSHIIEIDKSGNYILNISWETDSEELLTGFAIIEPNGAVKTYATADWTQMELFPMHYEKGTYELRLYFMTNEADIKEFCKDKDIDTTIYDGWPECTKDCYVKGDYSLHMKGLTDFQGGFLNGTILIGVIVIFMAGVLLAYKKSTVNEAMSNVISNTMNNSIDNSINNSGEVEGIIKKDALSTADIINTESSIVTDTTNKGDNTEAKNAYTFVGLALAVFGILVVGIQLIYPDIMVGIFGDHIVNAPWFDWLQVIIPTYGIGFLALNILCNRVEKTPIEQHKMTVGQFICCIFMNAGIIGVGTIIGTIINMAILSPYGAGNSNALTELMLNSDDFWRILTVGIGAPIFEELIFRKLIIDRVCKYGEGMAIIASGLLFGLFHGNFSQFFFAAGLGGFFAYIYLRTGKIWYTIAFHMIINLSTSAVTMLLYKNLDMELVNKIGTMDPMAEETQLLVMEILPELLLTVGWIAVLFISAIAGVIIWIVKAKKFYLVKQPQQMEGKKLRTVFGNFGMIYFILLCVFLFVQYYVGMIV